MFGSYSCSVRTISEFDTVLAGFGGTSAIFDRGVQRAMTK